MVGERFYRESRLLVGRYQPDVYQGRAVLFRAVCAEDPVPLWTGLALGGLEVHDMAGDHMDMMDEPTVGLVADVIRRRLDEADYEERHATTADTEDEAPIAS
jgi:thioesterase domain-containing protein